MLQNLKINQVEYTILKDKRVGIPLRANKTSILRKSCLGLTQLSGIRLNSRPRIYYSRQ